jgi:hypothetical protein
VDFDAEQGLTAEQQSQLGKTAAIVRFVPDPSTPESG